MLESLRRRWGGDQEGAMLRDVRVAQSAHRPERTHLSAVLSGLILAAAIVLGGSDESALASERAFGGRIPSGNCSPGLSEDILVNDNDYNHQVHGLALNGVQSASINQKLACEPCGPTIASCHGSLANYFPHSPNRNFVIWSTKANKDYTFSNLPSRGGSAVFYQEAHLHEPAFFNAGNSHVGDIKIGPDLALSDFAVHAGSDSGFDKRLVNVENTESSHSNRGDADEKHKHRPSSHIFLGAQVVLGALVLAGGLYGIFYAFEKSNAITRRRLRDLSKRTDPEHFDAGALYVFVGVLLVNAGGIIIMTALFP